MVLAWAGYDSIATFARIPGAYPLAREPRGMDEEFLLLNPGPAPVINAVSEAMASHRSAGFEAAYERARDVPGCVER